MKPTLLFIPVLAIACGGKEPVLLDDFALVDENPTSATYTEEVSPRDHLEMISGWYFTHAT